MNALILAVQNIWFIVAAILFLILILALLFNFFSVFLDFISAQGCFAVVLIFSIGLPSFLILCLAAGYNITSIILIVISVIGAVTGYMVRDTEGNLGKFSSFLMIVSIIALLITLFASQITRFL
jgi:hypothetical protein